MGNRERLLPLLGAALVLVWEGHGHMGAGVTPATCHGTCGTSGNAPRISETKDTITESSVAVQGGTAPLVQPLKSTDGQDVSYFHFPGHNRGKAAPSSLSDLIGLGAFTHDLPELPELDDLFYPKSVILDARRRAANLFESSKTWILVNGSTCGIQAAVMPTCSPGDYISIPRNCHISFISALVLSGVLPKYIIREYNSGWDIAGGVTLSQVDRALKELQGTTISGVADGEVNSIMVGNL